jgi:hypothetical protein
VEAVKKLKWIAYTIQQTKLAGWEGGLAPAQDRMTLSLELRGQGQAVWGWAGFSWM